MASMTLSNCELVFVCFSSNFEISFPISTKPWNKSKQLTGAILYMCDTNKTYMNPIANGIFTSAINDAKQYRKVS